MLAGDTWSVREIVVAAQPSKTDLQAGQEKFRASKPRKPEAFQTQYKAYDDLVLRTANLRLSARH